MRTKEQIIAEIIANEMVAEIMSPSEIRARFGTKEDLDAYKQYWKEHNEAQNKLLEELESTKVSG